MMVRTLNKPYTPFFSFSQVCAYCGGLVSNIFCIKFLNWRELLGQDKVVHSVAVNFTIYTYIFKKLRNQTCGVEDL